MSCSLVRLSADKMRRVFARPLNFQSSSQRELISDIQMDGNGSRDTAPLYIEHLKVRNFRALRKVEIKHLTPMTVLVGPNGSGKSTVFDAFAFLAECLPSGVSRPWNQRGRAKELKTRNAGAPVTIELTYRERPGAPLITYHLEVDECDGKPSVVHEWLRRETDSLEPPFYFLEYRNGVGQATSGDVPDLENKRKEIPLSSPDLLAVNALGQFQSHPRLAALRDFIMGWHVSNLSGDSARGQPDADPQEHLSTSGDNLANVIQYLSKCHPERLERIFQTLRRRVPRIERVLTEAMPDGRLMLQIKDAAFHRPVPAHFASDGTLKMLAYLALLHDPEPSPFIGIEAPENFLHPRLLYELAEECAAASEHTQLLVTTHSPLFLNALNPEQVHVLWRDENGHTQVRRVADLDGVPNFMKSGAQLGNLWMEGFFGVGDPLTRRGGERQ